MKANYEDRTRYLLSRRTNLIIRIDGKAFHTYTKGLEKPFDDGLMKDMNGTAIALCEGIQGAKLAYVQSDEISILVTDYDALETSAWYDNNLQKIVSVSASIATAEFNKLRYTRAIATNAWSQRSAFNRVDDAPVAHFDSRAFTIPEVAEVANYFLWRAQDATRNNIQSIFRYVKGHKEKVSILEQRRILDAEDYSWASVPSLHGRLVFKHPDPRSTPWWVGNAQEPTYSYWHDNILSLILNPVKVIEPTV